MENTGKQRHHETKQVSMWWWKKRKKENDFAIDGKAKSIAVWCVKQQLCISEKISKQLNKLSLYYLKLWLLLFCVAGGGFSIYIFFASVKSKASTIKIESIRTPVSLDQLTNTPRENFVDEELFSRIQKFKKNMDSLSRCNQKAFDSIQRRKQGLLDSVQELEKIYYSQKNK